MDFQTFRLIKIIFFNVPAILFTYKIFSTYYSTSSHSPLLKKAWAINVFLTAYDFSWAGLVGYKTCYQTCFPEEVPPPIYLFLARLVLFIWPLVIFLYVYMYEQLLTPRWKPQKHHYIFGAITLGLLGYFGYCLFIRTPLSPDPWFTLDSFCNSLARSFKMITIGTTCIVENNRLSNDPKISLITKQQAKLVGGWLFIPSIITQPLWILIDYNLTPQNSFTFEAFVFSVALIVIGGSFYARFMLFFRLRLFNVSSAVHEIFPRSFSRPLSEVTAQIRQATTLQEVCIRTKTFFERAFGIKDADVTLYIRPTGHERNLSAAQAVRILPQVEAVLGAAGTPLCEKIKEKRVVLHAEVAYDESLGLDPDAQELCTFMEQIKAEVFLPIYGKKACVGYIIINRNPRSGKLVTDNEVDSMLTYVDHISHVIEQMQQMDPAVLEKESLEHKHHALLLFQEQEHYREGMRTIVKTQASEATSMIFMKERCLYVANDEGAELLGIPPGTYIIDNAYAQPIKQLINNFKRYGRQNAILLKDLQGNPLHCSVMRDTKKKNAVVIISRPTVSTLFKFPPFTTTRNCDDWAYAVFLQTTASGQLIEKFIPATEGILFDFKIKLLQALFSRRPLFLKGADEDVEQLAILAQQIYARATFKKITPEQPEQNDQEIAIQLFGKAPLKEGGAILRGYLATLSATGTLLLEHIERLSPKTQDSLAKFFTTGYYTSCYAKQLMTSDISIICSSHEDLNDLVDKNAFSAALYDELTKNSLEVPSLHQLSRDQLHDLVSDISTQILGESSTTHDMQLPAEIIEEIIDKRLPSTLCKLHQLVEKRLDITQHKKVPVTTVLLPKGYDDKNALIAEAQRLGKKALKNKEFLRILFKVFPSYLQIAQILEVNRSSVFRAYKRYHLGTFAPGYEPKPKQTQAQPES